MTGHCNADNEERAKLRSINGYGSNALLAKITFTVIHQKRTPKNVKINDQEPPKSAILSATR